MELAQKIEASVAPSLKFDDFAAENAFVARVKANFGGSLNDRRRHKHFHFLGLKIVWAQFLLRRPIGEERFEALSAFEKVIFFVFLRRFGFCAEPLDSLLRKSAAQIDGLANWGQKSEKELLATALKQVFKKLMFPYSEPAPRRPFEQDTRPVQISKQAGLRMTRDFFAGVPGAAHALGDFAISEETLRDSRSMVAFIGKMAQSPRIRRAVDTFFSAKADGSPFPHSAPDLQRASARQKRQIYLRQQSEILSKLNQRLTNYEVILNQFCPRTEAKRVVQWMGVIVKDLKLNPDLSFPRALGEVEEALGLFLSYFNRARRR